MSLFFHILSFIFLSISSPANAFQYNITFSSPNQNENGTISLIRGVYAPITIEIIPFNPETSTTLSLELILSDNRFHLSDNIVKLSTNETRLIHTFIGTHCESNFSTDEIENGISISIDNSTSTEECNSEKQLIFIVEQVNEFEVSFSSTSIPKLGYGVVSLKKSLNFTDAIDLAFEYDPSYQHFHIDSPMVIFPHYNPDTYTNIMTKYYINSTEITFNQVSVKVTIQNKEVEKCYKIADNSLSFLISVDDNPTIVDPRGAWIPIWFGTESTNDNSVYVFSINNKPLPNTLMSCVITDNSYPYPSESDILSQNYTQNNAQMRYFRLFFGDNVHNFKYEFNTLNRYIQYKYKCALENNMLQDKSSDYRYDFFGSKRSINLIDAIEYKAHCLEFNFSSIQKENEFQQKLQTYTYTKLYRNASSFSENSCLNVRYNSFKDYFKQTSGHIAFLCIYPAGQCRYLLNKDNVNKNIEDVFSVLKDTSNLKSKLNLQSDVYFNSINDIDYPGNSNETMLNVHIKENKKEYIKIDMQMKTSNVRSPFKCEYELTEFKGDDAFYFKFYPEGKPSVITFSSDYKTHSDIQIAYPENTENQLHSLNFKCSYFPDIPDLNSSSYTFSYMFINRTESEYFNCEEELHRKTNAYCLNNKIKKLEFINVHNTPIYVKNLNEDVKAFDKVLFEFKENRIKSILTKALGDTNITDILTHLITFEEYLRKFNCMQSKDKFSTCIEKKKQLQIQGFSKYRDHLKTIEGNYVDYFKSLPQDQVQDVYYGIFMFFITILNNMDSVADLHARMLIKQLTAYIAPSQTISAIIQQTLITDEDKHMFKEDLNLLLLNFTLGYNDLITHCSRKQLINNEDLDDVYEQFTTQIFENFITNGKYSINNEKYIFKYESNFDESRNRTVESNTKISITVEVPEKTIQQQMNIIGYSFVAYNEFEAFLLQDNLTSVADLMVSIKPFFTDNTLNKEKSLPILNNSKIKYEFDFSSANANEFTVCYHVMFNGSLHRDNVTSKYDEATSKLTCESSVFGDIIVGKNVQPVPPSPPSPPEPTPPEGGNSTIFRYVMIALLVIVLVIAVVVVVVKCFRNKGDDSDLQNFDETSGSRGDLKLIPSFDN